MEGLERGECRGEVGSGLLPVCRADSSRDCGHMPHMRKLALVEFLLLLGGEDYEARRRVFGMGRADNVESLFHGEEPL